MSEEELDSNLFDNILHDQHPWTVKDIGNNSISSMLEYSTPPSALSFLSKTIKKEPLPVPPVILPKVYPRDFDAYLASISKVIDKYQLYKALGASALEGVPNLEAGTEDVDFDEIMKLVPIKVTKSMDRMNRSRMGNSGAIVPELFALPGFNLERIDIFTRDVRDEAGYRALQDQLTGFSDTIEVELLQEISKRSSSFFGALESLEQLEKETKDCVETIDGLRASIDQVREKCVKSGLKVVRIKQKRSNVVILHGAVKLLSQAKQSLPVIEQLLEQKDYVGALDLLDEASKFLKGASGEKRAGKELAVGLTLVKESIVPSDLDLRGVEGARQLSIQLGEISRKIAKVMEQEFTDNLLKDLLNQLDVIANTPYSQQNIPSGSLLGVASSAIRTILSEKYIVTTASTATIPEKMEMPPLSIQDQGLKSTLKPLVVGLLRTDKLEDALKGYKEALFKQLKNVSKQHYPKSATSASQKEGTVMTKEAKKVEQEEVGKLLKSMSFDAFYSTLIKVYIFFLRALQRGAIVNEIIISLIRESEDDGVQIGSSRILAFETLKEKSPTKVPVDDEDEDLVIQIGLEPRQSDVSKSSLSEFSQIVLESKNILNAATDLCHVRCAKLVAVRQDQNSQLNPKDFYRLFNATWEFLTACERLCGKVCFGLKGSILSQAKSYINYFHEEKSKQIALLLDNEQWLQADIPIDFQHMVEKIIASAPSPSVPLVIKKAKGTHPLDVDDGDISSLQRDVNSSTESFGEGTGGVAAVSSKYLTVDGARYYAVVAALLFLKSLVDYVQCAQNVPSLTPEILVKIYEFLKLFNSRTCQLVLGSGAMKSAGLHSLTAKHITLTSQSLGLVMAIIPYIRSVLAQHLNPRQSALLVDFDRIIGDYRDHQNELYMNLVGIMTERLNTHAAINWDTPDQKDFGSDGISVTMSTLVLETITLHKVISKYLPKESIKSIMNEIFRSFLRRLEDDLKKVDLFSSSADAHHFTETLSTLAEVDGPGPGLEVCVNNIKIKDRRTYQPPKPASTPPPKAPPTPSKFGYNFGKWNPGN